MDKPALGLALPRVERKMLSTPVHLHRGSPTNSQTRRCIQRPIPQKEYNTSGMSGQWRNRMPARVEDAFCDCSRVVVMRENDTVRLASKSRFQITNTGNYLWT